MSIDTNEGTYIGLEAARRMIRKEESLFMFKHRYPLQLPIQFFAADTGGQGGGASDPDSDKGGGADNDNPKSGQGATDPVFTSDQQAQIDAMIKSAQDAVRNQYGREVKDLKATVKQLQDAGKTKEEIASEKEQALQVREMELLAKDNQFHALRALSEAKLDSKFLEFVVTNEGTDVDGRNSATDAKIKTLKETIDKAIAEQVEVKFKELGYKPGAGKETPPTSRVAGFVDTIKKHQIKK